MNNVIKIIAAILLVILAFKIVGNFIGLIIGVALAAVVVLGAQKLLEKK
ncbi:hypothetical protein [Sphingomicrobium flavum]|nr:hypothetical protein [Sphingomicrobium flavum]